MQPGCRLCNAFNLPTHLCRRPARPAVPPRSTRGCWSQQPQYQVRRCIHRLPHSTLQSSCSHLQQQLSAMVDATAAKTGTLKPVWLDCDPGHDDAMAIILAGYSPALKLLGISTVASNQVVEKTTRNALDVLDLCGLSHVGVVKGQAKPLVRDLALTCPQIHGETGLDGPHGGPVLPHSQRQPLPGKAVNVMFAAIQQQYTTYPQEGKVQLICTGALTNAALLLVVYPEVKDMIDITIMGGAIGVRHCAMVYITVCYPCCI
eukprot:GHUV01053349.1.p1 GENE.GHUV01053349.1~~GHUV01053349.1.p1  ORF type:complete len:261 (+),score=52.90 GHUV01053349.1:1337-2119(+)